MHAEAKMTFLDRFRAMRETQFGAFVPVLLALAAIWGYFGLVLPAYDVMIGEAESFRAIFLSPRNIYNLFMQSAVIATLAVGITIVLLLGEIDLSAAATAGVCAALLGVLVLAGVPGWLACIIVMGVGIVMGAVQGVLVAYVGIPSFVVTLAGLLGYQGLMQKILPTGNLNVGDAFVRGIARVLIPDMWGLALAVIGRCAFCLQQSAQTGATTHKRPRVGKPPGTLGAGRSLWCHRDCRRSDVERLPLAALAACPACGVYRAVGVDQHIHALWPVAVCRGRQC